MEGIYLTSKRLHFSCDEQHIVCNSLCISQLENINSNMRLISLNMEQHLTIILFSFKNVYKERQKFRDHPNINTAEYMSSDTSAYLCGPPQPWPVRLCKSGSGWRGCHRRVCVSYAPLCCRHCHCPRPSLLVMGLGGWSLSQEHSHLMGRQILVMDT